jgi:class 3 adenylate cyclase/CHASE2 domain-containing sensor protein
MQFIRNLKHIFIVFLIVFVSVFGMIRIFGDTFFVSITHFFVYREGNPLLDKLYKYKFTPSHDIVIVKIDNDSLNQLQANTNIKTVNIPKSVYTSMVEKLSSVAVKGIAFDIVFQNIDPDEEVFARTMENASNVVIARTNQVGKCIFDPSGYETCEWIPRSVYAGVKQGLIDINPLGDRKIAILSTASGEVDTLALALYRSRIDTEPIPFGENIEILTPFFWWPQSYPSISFASVLEMSKVELAANFWGKYIFIGESGTLIHDAIRSPVTDTLMDWVETHAHFLDGIVQKRFLTSWSVLDPRVFAGLATLLLLMVTLYMIAPKYVSLFLAVFVTIWIVWMARFGYFQHGVVLDIAPVLMAGSVLSFPITYIYRFFIVDREKRALTDAFSHYVDPRVVAKIGDSAHEIRLGGEAKNLTILFSDIAGFTTLSEKLTPSDLFYLMSSYLSRMTSILTQNGGTLDKYIGDAVMGFYGAPLDMLDHPLHACHTALEMRRALPVFNTELLARGLDEIDFRIGIATWDVVVGNIWSHDRFNYTVLGDTVNLASRLEATSKEYGTHIIVSHGTYEGAKSEFYFRRLDKIAVKGKTEWVMIYELIANIRDTSIDRYVYERYEQGLEKYFAWDYLGAGKLFESNASLDAPSKMMAHRCLDILEGRVKVEGGVYVMTHK